MHMYEAIGVWPLGTGKPMFGRPTGRSTYSYLGTGISLHACTSSYADYP